METAHATSLHVGLHKGRIAFTFTFAEGEPKAYLLTVDAARTFAKGTLDLLAELEAFLHPPAAPYQERMGLSEEARVTLTPPSGGLGGSNGH